VIHAVLDLIKMVAAEGCQKGHPFILCVFFLGLVLVLAVNPWGELLR